MISILELAQIIGLHPKKTAATNGGEYHCSCPACGTGVDRLALWPAQNRYWCRRCGVFGDEIQFCRDYLRMPFGQACEYVGKNPYQHQYPAILKPKAVKESRCPSKIWQETARLFLDHCLKELDRSDANTLLSLRRITLDTAKQFSVGFNSQDWHRPAHLWGLTNRDRIFLPAGLVIPSFAHDSSAIQGIKIRRLDGCTPKYLHVAGSGDAFYVYGYRSHTPLVILESELDATLLMQEVGDLVWCIATGGASKKPDAALKGVIEQSPLLIHCPDFDDAGWKAIAIWNSYPHYLLYPTPVAKSVGDAYLSGLSIRDWILGALDHAVNQG